MTNTYWYSTNEENYVSDFNDAVEQHLGCMTIQDIVDHPWLSVWRGEKEEPQYLEYAGDAIEFMFDRLDENFGCPNGTPWAEDNDLSTDLIAVRAKLAKAVEAVYDVWTVDADREPFQVHIPTWLREHDPSGFVEYCLAKKNETHVTK